MMIVIKTRHLLDFMLFQFEVCYVQPGRSKHNKQ
jgi:hypothetical protein